VDGGHVRIGHVRDQADPGREEMRVLLGAVDGGREFRAEAPADGRDVDPHLLEYPALHHPAHAAAAREATWPGLRFGVGILALPRRIGEARVAARLRLDLLELGADPVAQRFEPVACRLLLVVEFDH
jgi:hypothetical protein